MAQTDASNFYNIDGNWRAAGSLPDRSVGNVSGIRDAKDFTE